MADIIADAVMGRLAWLLGPLPGVSSVTPLAAIPWEHYLEPAGALCSDSQSTAASIGVAEATRFDKA